MILLNDFYSIVQQITEAGSVHAKIAFNKSHKILKGHFPGLPIVPGVCMMQIIVEMVEACTGKKVTLIAADTMKFLSVINPEKNNEVEVAINFTEDAGQFLVHGNLFLDTVTYFKLKATLKII